MQTYAVYWSDPSGGPCAGRLSLGPSAVELDGARSRRIALDDIESVDYERGRLHVFVKGGGWVTIGSVDKPGALWELAGRLKAELLVERLRGHVSRPVAPGWA